MFDLKVLYEDNHIIAVYKPHGVLSQGDASGDVSIMDHIKDYLSVQYNKPGAVYLGLVHRLDRVTAGVMIFARTSKAASRLSAQIRERDFHKEYEAIIEGALPVGQTGTLQHFLVKDASTKKASVYDTPRKNSREALLKYTVLESRDTTSRVHIILHTGRFHQIRAQFSHIGHPLVGDVKYGAQRQRKDRAVLLTCTKIVFTHPTTAEAITITSP